MSLNISLDRKPFLLKVLGDCMTEQEEVLPCFSIKGLHSALRVGTLFVTTLAFAPGRSVSCKMYDYVAIC